MKNISEMIKNNGRKIVFSVVGLSFLGLCTYKQKHENKVEEFKKTGTPIVRTTTVTEPSNGKIKSSTTYDTLGYAHKGDTVWIKPVI